MPRIPAFVGPAYRSQALTAAADRVVNLYPESLENSGEVKANAVLYPTPGIDVFCQLPQGPIRAIFAQNGRCWVIAGTGLYELRANGTYITYAFPDGISPGPGRPTFSSNGTAGDQLFIVAGGFGYVHTLSNGATMLIDDPSFPQGEADCGQFVDGYFAVLRRGTTEWRISQLFNGMVWPGADVAQRSFASDIIASMAVTHREVWLIGTQTSEVWYNSGATFPFQPISGVFLEEGCSAPDSVVNLSGVLYWVSENQAGARRVVRAGSGGYQPQRISTHAIEYALQGYGTVADAVAYGYQDQGHEFYVLMFPSAGATWVYDATTGLWHERGAWDMVAGDYILQRQQCHAYAFGLHLVGDRQSGAVWRQSIEIPTDGVGLIRRARTFVHLSDELKWSFYDQATLDLDTGLSSVAPTIPAPYRFTAPGSYQWVAPYTGVVQVDVWGGGGGSQGIGTGTVACGGAGGGGFARRNAYDVVAGQTYTVIVGAGGVGGVVSAGGTGGTSSFESTVMATGGQGGLLGSGNPSGGTGVIGDVMLTGGSGGSTNGAATTYGGSGGGAAGPTGNGGNGGANSNSPVAGGAGNPPGADGGAGGTSGAPTPGNSPGGGAGGGVGVFVGVPGGDGAVHIVYTSLLLDQEPRVMMRWSNDGGRTFGAERLVGAGKQGEYSKRARWTRLGRGRDRVFEIAMSDAIPWRLSNLYLQARGGNS